MAWTNDDYLRLGEQLRAARRAAGYKSLKQFQDFLDSDADISLTGRTYADIEGGKLRKRKRFSPESLAELEDLFGWAPGVTRSILDNKRVDLFTGVETIEAGGWRYPVGATQFGTDADWESRIRSEIEDAMADVDGRFLELEDRVRQLERRVLGARVPKVPQIGPDVVWTDAEELATDWEPSHES